MSNWIQRLKFDPIPVLIKSENTALAYFAQRDLSENFVESVETLWNLPSVLKMISKQQIDGSWKYHNGESYVRSQQNYNQLETYRILGQLVELYGLTSEHSTIKKAADFLFSFQTEEGDFRGIYGTQYTPNYSAAIMELLIKAGYEEDPRIEKGFKWLLSIRQNDGGWVIPLRTIGIKAPKLLQIMKEPELIKPDKSKPFSHCVTGIVLRAFSAHRKYRKTKEAMVAGELLKSGFFQPDRYPDRKDPIFWTRFTFPFWFTDLLSALDSLSVLGFTKDDPQIEPALKWLSERQQEDGLWKLTLLKAKSIDDLPLWISLTICRIFKKFYEKANLEQSCAC
jgi:hypothetical protein